LARISPHRIELQVTDPEGRTVRLRTAVWVRHVLVLHPQMFSHRDEVRDAIADPDEIWQQWDGREEWLIYSKPTNAFPPCRWLRVPTRCEATGWYDVRSAYPTLEPVSEGKRIWKRK